MSHIASHNTPESADKNTARTSASSARPGSNAAQKNTLPEEDRVYARPENEDDDGYDPWSDRRPHEEPLFQSDPWA